MKPGDRWHDLQVIAELPREDFDDNLAADAVYIPHLANMARKVTVIDEPRQGPLKGQRCVPVGHFFRPKRRRTQRSWHHDKSEANRWQHGLRK